VTKAGGFYSLLFLILIVSGEEMNVLEKIGSFAEDARRIFYVSKKPTVEEYKRIALIVAIGFLVIGVLGYIIYLFFAITGLGF
jgi:protein translocase SEC61 complex gamma subunit